MLKKKKVTYDASMALVKYEHKGLVPVSQQPSIVKKSSRAKHLLNRANMPLSTKTFILSHLGLLISSLLFLSVFYYILNKDSYSPTLSNEYIPITTKPASFNLEINNPDDELLTFDRTLVISGTSVAKAAIVITSEGVTPTYQGLEADSTGRFQKGITLSPGLNRIEVTSFDFSGNTKTVSRTVYYSEEALP